jgi:hypothetical protein
MKKVDEEKGNKRKKKKTRKHGYYMMSYLGEFSYITYKID